MRHTRLRVLGAALVAAATAAGTLTLAPSALAAGEIGLTSFDVAYTQSFDTLASIGTSSTVPTGWAFVESGTNANTLYTAGTGSGNGGDTYSFGAAGSSDRAFGGLQSGSLIPTIGASFVNNSGGTITSVDVAYTGEQWRLGATGRGADRLDFQVSTDATALKNGTWTNVDTLDFSSPVTVGTAGELDGNVSADRTALSATIGDLSVAQGGTLWIRWSDFNVTSSDDGLGVDDFSLTPHGTTGPADVPPTVESTTPANDAVGVPVGADLTVTFSEDVTLGEGAFRLSCDGTQVPFDVAGSGAGYTIDPQADFADGASCVMAVEADAVTDVDGTPDHLAEDYVTYFYAGDVCTGRYTAAPAIQGSGDTTPLAGDSLTTRGVVVGDYEGSTSLNGFYLQDLTGDGDPATSDAVFVYSPGRDDVSVGDVVWVAGRAGENFDQTQVSRFSGVPVQDCGTGSVDPVDLTLPFDSVDAPERYEGMLVRMPQTLSVTEHFQLGRFGQVLVSSGGRLQQPTSVVAPGAAAQTMQAANDLNQVIVDDNLQTQNPDPIALGRGGQPLSASNTLRGGDTITGLHGVLTYTWAGNSASGNAWRVRPLGALGGGAPDFQPANPRPAGAPERAAGTDVRVAGMNLLNFFNTFDGLPDRVDNCTLGVGGDSTDCRGADTQAEFDRQWPKTVAGIVGTGADVIGINEIENDGYGADSAIQFLVDKLNADTAPGTYAFIDVDAGTGQQNAAGTDAIKVGVLYKPAVVKPVGSTAALNTLAFVNGGDGFPRSRPSIAQAFEDLATGARFVVDVNHLKSKGSACDVPDPGDGSGNCNAERTKAAQELAAWLATDPTGTGDPDVLLVGDYNSYAQETPVTTLEAAGYTNLIRSRIGEKAYSYVFDGQWGYLDYAFGTASLQTQLAAVHEWHINSDEPSVLDYNTDFKSSAQQSSLYAPDEFRISDHDPVLVDLDLTVPYDFTGFYPPLKAAPALATAKAGAAVPVQFGLGGDRGTDVFASGPTVTQVSCDTLAVVGSAVPASAVGGGVQYDPATDTYTYVWKTEKSWKGTCRAFTFGLNDASGRTSTAYVRFS